MQILLWLSAEPGCSGAGSGAERDRHHRKERCKKAQSTLFQSQHGLVKNQQPIQTLHTYSNPSMISFLFQRNNPSLCQIHSTPPLLMLLLWHSFTPVQLWFGFQILFHLNSMSLDNVWVEYVCLKSHVLPETVNVTLYGNKSICACRQGKMRSHCLRVPSESNDWGPYEERMIWRHTGTWVSRFI